MRGIKGSKRKLCKFKGNVGIILNGGGNLVEKAEVLNTFLPQSSPAKITPRFPGGLGKEQVRDKAGMN